MILRRIGTLIHRNIPQLTLPNRKSFHSSASSKRSLSNHFIDDEEGGSAIYRLALKFQRPTTVKMEPRFRNRISLIGTVDGPLKVMNTAKSGSFGVQTWLYVNTQNDDSDRRFRISLKMWNEMGKICMEHVKPGDFIYVSGFLGSFSKPTVDKKLVIYYEVNVKELNFVGQQGQRSSSTTQTFEELETKQDVVEAGMGMHDSRQLNLWQVFFTSPFEWRDNRKSKKNPRQPDFKHKDTGEALWLSPNDPPWIKKKLELLDSRLAEDVVEAGMGRHDSELYLWQVFFTSPFEWWDNRKNKRNPRQPDFQHKDTNEALWLSPNDPPWVKKQLELLDSRLAEGLGDRVSRRRRVSEWVYDE